MCENDNMIGKRFGHWEVLELSGKTDKRQNKYYICRCDCGNIADVAGYKLRSGWSKSCGCTRQLDMTGQKVGRLTFIKIVGQNKYKNNIWECQCDCGNVVHKTVAKAKAAPSCGCMQKESAKKSLCENNKKQKFIDGTNICSLHQKLSKNNTSGVNGVSFCKEKGKWRAQIMFKGKTHHLGYYDTIKEAAEIRKIAEKELFGKAEKEYNEQTNNSKEG